MIYALHLVACIIALPFAILGFIYQTIIDGFKVGVRFYKLVYEIETGRDYNEINTQRKDDL